MSHSDVSRFLQALSITSGIDRVFVNLSHDGTPPFHTHDWQQLAVTRGCYFSPGRYKPGTATNLKSELLDVVALIIDDVGTKVPESNVLSGLGAPTTIVRSSKGNYQWGYRLSVPVPADRWDGFFAAIIVAIGVTPDNASGQALFRLPMGLNTKTGAFRHQVELVGCDPGVVLDVGKYPHLPTGPGPSATSSSGGSGTVGDISRLVDLIPNVGPAPDYEWWVEMLHRIHALAGDKAKARDAAETWSSQHPAFDQAEFDRVWPTLNPTRTSGKELLVMAQKEDPKGYEKWLADEAGPAFDDGSIPPPPVAKGGGYSITHADMAAAIVAAQRGALGWLSNSKGSRWGAFDPTLGRWIVYDHDALMRAAVRDEVETARRIADEKTSRKLAEAKWQGAVQSLLTRNTELLIPFEDMDADLDMFGVPGGVVRLGTGGAVEEAGKASQMVSRAVSIKPAPRGTRGAAWEKFLDDFTMKDPELRLWWQAFCGYCLTGHINEHLVVFLYGPGGNGKSVFLDTLAEVMGPYHERAASAVFMAQQGSKHMAMVADLCGARLVTSPDVPLGAVWDLGMLKPLTGGGTFKAQFMKENWFAFIPQFKLILAGNEKPILGTVDAAVRRRFVLVPAMHVPKVVNKNLVDVLRNEKAAILRWMIDGWEMYNIGGLPPCKRIERETADYIAEQDTFAKWMGDTLTKTPGDMTRHRLSDLWQSWDGFRASEGAWKAAPVRKEALSTKLKEAGFSVSRDEKGAYVDQVAVTKTAVF
jgi:P4 family phage/plasmid primase-like protien